MNNFNSVVKGSLDIAHAKALELKNNELVPAHLLFGLIENPTSYSFKSLKDHQDHLNDLLEKCPRIENNHNLEVKASGQFTSWITQASAHATKSGREEISEKDLLRFLPSFFPSLNIDYSKFNDVEDEEGEVPHFLIDLNQKAKDGKLDPVIGRTKEIRSVMEILGRRSKNNPVLVGAPGVGKTAIVEGLAVAIVKGQTPDVLKSKTIYSLDLGLLMAGTKFRGEFEERIQALLKFAEKEAGQAIIFIDEMHQLIGAGKTDGAMDAANLLKPALARGDLFCIGATTENEFQKYVLGDQALERRFRKVTILPPTKEDSIEILMGLKEKFEGHHGVKITDDAIYSAVMLSDQYITDKNLPDKAIDLIDEASSALKLSAEAMPTELELLKSEIRNKRILAAVESNHKSEDEIKGLQEKFDEEYIKWEREVSSLKKVSNLRSQLDRLKFDLEQAEFEQNYEEASKIKYMLVPEIEKELDENAHDWELKKEHIGKIISRHTGIPVEKILKEKQESLLNLESFLNERIFGQEGSLHEISESLIASYAGLTDDTRPLGSFILKGPTGVGKTETAKALAKYLFDSEDNIVRFDMSEYSEKHSVSKLIGAPAGYIGYDEGGVLTEAIRRKPYAVILFDEIEKAHNDFSDILLQLLDDGRLTDNKGRTINFKNTIVLLTSNSKNIETDFKPEVLGRLDGVLTYNSLDQSVMENLVVKQIELLEKKILEKGASIVFSEGAINHLSTVGYDERYGARPLKTVFNRLIIRPLAKLVLAGDLEGKEIKIGAADDKISFSIGG